MKLNNINAAVVVGFIKQRGIKGYIWKPESDEFYNVCDLIEVKLKDRKYDHTLFLNGVEVTMSYKELIQRWAVQRSSKTGFYLDSDTEDLHVIEWGNPAVILVTSLNKN